MCRFATYDVTGLLCAFATRYQLRLCPAAAELTEECFQKMPLPFVGKQYLQEVNSTTVTYIESKYAYANGTVAAITADGQKPTGNTWAMNPLPDGTQKGSIGAYSKEWEFKPPCKFSKKQSNCLI